MPRWRLLLWALAALLFVLAQPVRAQAFCGFFVSGAGSPLGNDATQVALMRDGTRTVLSMRNSYQGPPEDFALVVPVPVVLQKENVRTLPVALFDHLDRLSAPRLVEYWEQDPCPYGDDSSDDRKEGGTGARAKGEEGSMGAPRAQVRVESQFSVDEYDIVVLSADDSSALEAWLRQNRYHLPDGIEPFLRPYILAGSKFFVARVDARRVRFLWDRAQLSPLRFHYDSDRFELPIRLGLANAQGPQDLVVYVLAPGSQRYEVANYDNVFIPTNLDVRDEVRGQFGSFYASLFDRAVASKPRAVVTEYAWSTASCDPCPTPPLDAASLGQLGLDALAPSSSPRDFTLTRLHARYGRESLGDDFTFRQAPAVAGGNEAWRGENSQGAIPAHANSFQARYIVRHGWEGPVVCAHPRFGQWGGPPDSRPAPPPPPRAGEQVRRDAPLDRLIVPAGEEASHQARMEHPDKFRFLRERFDALLEGSRDALPIFLLLELIAVVVVARRWRVGALKHALAFAALVALPLVPIGLSREWARVSREVGLPAVFWALGGLAAAVVLLRRAAARAARAPERLAAWAVAGAALVPAAAGLGAQAWTLHRVHEIGATMAPDARLWMRIQTQAESEADSGLMMGLWASGGLLLLASLWRAARPADEAPAARLDRATVLGALGALGATVLTGLLLSRVARGLDAFDAPVLTGSLLAGAVGVRLARRGDRAAARDVLGLTLLAALLLAVTPWLGTMRTMLSGLSSESLDEERLARLLDRGLSESRSHLRMAPALALLLVAPAAVAAWVTRARSSAGPGATSRAARGPGLAALTVALGVIGYGGLVHGIRTAAGPAAPHERERLAAVAGLQPPAPPAAGGTEAPLTGPLLVVEASGRLLGSTATTDPLTAFDDARRRAMGQPSADVDAPLVPLLQADRRLSYGALRGSLGPLLSRRQGTFRWLVGGNASGDPRLDGAHPRRIFEVELLDRVEARVPAGDRGSLVNLQTLAAQHAGESLDLRLVQGGRGHYEIHDWALPSRLTDAQFDGKQLPGVLDDARSRVTEMVVVVDEAMTVDEVSSLLARVETFPQERAWGSAKTRAVPVVVTTDRSVMASSGASAR